MPTDAGVTMVFEPPVLSLDPPSIPTVPIPATLPPPPAPTEIPASTSQLTAVPTPVLPSVVEPVPPAPPAPEPVTRSDAPPSPTIPLRDQTISSNPVPTPKRLEGLFHDAGLQDINVERVSREGTIDGFDDYWEPIEEGVGQIPQAYHALSETDRRSVREAVRSRLAQYESADGKLTMNVEMAAGGHRQVKRARLEPIPSASARALSPPGPGSPLRAPRSARIRPQGLATRLPS